MAESELSRVEQKIFGQDGATSKFGQIGSKANGAAVYTKNLKTIQSLELFLKGWADITDDASVPPRMEDMNSLDYLITSQLAYIFQMGIPEWVNSETARYYAEKSICRRNGSVYLAIQGDDVSNINAEKDPETESEWWKKIIDRNITITSGGTMGESSAIVPTEDRIRSFLSSPSFIKWTSPRLVGEDFYLGELVAHPALAALNSTDVAFISLRTPGILKLYRQTDGIWSMVGTGLEISDVGAPALAALNNTDVALIDSITGELTTYRWDETTETWSMVGTGLEISNVGTPALAALNSTDVAFIDGAFDTLLTYRWDDTAETWSMVGTGLEISNAGYLSLTALNSTDVAFIDGDGTTTTTFKLSMYRWDESTETWSMVGTALEIYGRSLPALAALNNTDVALVFSVQGILQTYRWNESAETWSMVGEGLVDVAIGFTSLATLNGTDVALVDGGTSESTSRLRTCRFDFQIAGIMPHSVSGGAF